MVAKKNGWYGNFCLNALGKIKVWQTLTVWREIFLGNYSISDKFKAFLLIALRLPSGSAITMHVQLALKQNRKNENQIVGYS